VFNKVVDATGVVLHVVDAFADRPFAGNPAAICPRPGPLDERWMQRVAREMNLSETAFLHPIEGGFSLRWFTPTSEVKLCGHATLASAHVLWETGVLRPDEVARFYTLSGWLTCRKDGAWIEMDFPALTMAEAEAPAGLAEALGVTPSRVARSAFNCLVELENAAAVRSMKPDLSRLAAVDTRGVIVTAQGETGSGYDFVSRFFAPRLGINEDPATGSAHCALAPYWRVRLGRDEFTAYQASERGGVLGLAVRGARVLMSGQAVTVSRVQLMPTAAAMEGAARE
jgi:PhzF family phenazine biosynthesis protein